MRKKRTTGKREMANLGSRRDRGGDGSKAGLLKGIDNGVEEVEGRKSRGAVEKKEKRR